MKKNKMELGNGDIKKNKYHFIGTGYRIMST